MMTLELVCVWGERVRERRESAGTEKKKERGKVKQDG
jgi:hypothetical protein